MSSFKRTALSVGLLINAFAFPAIAATGSVPWTNVQGAVIDTSDPTVVSFPFIGTGIGTATANLTAPSQTYKLTLSGVTGISGFGLPNFILFSNGSTELFSSTGSAFSSTASFNFISSTFGNGVGTPYSIVGTFVPTENTFKLSGVNISAQLTVVPVPGPVAGAGLPMFMLGAIGFLLYRRRRVLDSSEY